VLLDLGGVRLRLDGEPAHDTDQLGMRGVVRIAEFVNRMRVGKLTQPDEFEDPLPAVQWQFGRPAGEQDVPQLAFAEKTIEFGHRHIDQEQHENSNLDLAHLDENLI
jgi:hypothetical protein